MKKTLLIVIPILILIVSCAIILGLVLAHKRSGYKSSAGKKEAPQVEYITFTYSGGISGNETFTVLLKKQMLLISH